MSVKTFTKSKKYMTRILIFTTLSILLLMSLFAATLYYNVGQELKKNEFDNATKLIQQIKFNFETVEGIIKDISIRIFFSSEATNLMYMDEDKFNYADYIERCNNIVRNEVTVLDKFIYSMYIYNNKQKKVLQVINHPYDEDIEFIRSVETGKKFPKLKPVIREIPFSKSLGDEKEKVFTYFMYQFIDKKNSMDGAVIINIKSDWLTDNIKRINVLGKSENVYIIDEYGNYVNIYNSNENKGILLSKKLIKEASNKKTGIFEENISGIPHFVTYTYLENSSLILVKTQPVSVAYKNLKSIKDIIIIVTLIFIFLAIITSFTISERIYKPVQNLFNKVISDDTKDIKGQVESWDEIGYLEKVYRESMEKIKNFELKKIFNENITRTYWLKKILSDGIELDRHEYDNLATENGFKVAYEGFFSVLILKVDNYLEFIDKNDLRERNLKKYAIMNIAVEIVSEKYTNECVEINDEHVALIIDVKDNDLQEFHRILEGLVRRAQGSINDYYGISITASVSDIVNNINYLPKMYTMAIANSVYRFVFGKCGYITQEKINLNKDKKIRDAKKNEVKLLEYIRRKDMERSKEELLKIISILKDVDYDSIFLYIIQLTDTIKKAVEQLTSEKSVGYSDILKRITTLETIDEFYRVLENYLNQAIMNVSDINSSNQLIIETVKEIIQTKYSEPGLCLQQIASMLKMSPRKLSSIFKEIENISVSNYIKEIRLLKVVHLLETSRLNVNEIIEKVGITNETYFYSIFREKYGLTPKEFAIQKNIDKLISNSPVNKC